jgi:hypothetical protein
MANTFTYDLQNLKLGACKVWVDAGAGYAPIGVTIDAQTVSYTPKFSDITANETGMTLLDQYLIGEELKFSMTMLEWTDDNFKIMFPFATEFSGTGKSYGFGAPTYGAISEKFIKIKIHPVNQAGTNNADDETVLTYDYTFWQCANVAATPITFEKDKPMGAKVEFNVYWDASKAAGMNMALRGDPANTALDITRPTVSTLKVEKSNVLTAVVKGTELTGVDVDTTIQLVFSEELQSGSALNYANYTLINVTSGAQIDLSAATITYTNATKTVLITPAASLTTSVHYLLGVVGVKDTAGNQIIPDVRTIQAA